MLIIHTVNDCYKEILTDYSGRNEQMVINTQCNLPRRLYISEHFIKTVKIKYRA
jgi:hypothetical protein